jgi:3-hydroxyisobutyrate dehydrogenase
MNNGVFGTGLLGSAMVERMLAQGDSVTVWNRTVSKAQALQPAGVTLALTAERQSPQPITCILR